MYGRLIVRVAALVVCALLLAGSPALGSLFVFQPDPADMYDLDHRYYFTWGINWGVPEDHVIIGARLFFNDIRNWDDEPNDLYAHLLDDAPEGLDWGWDGQDGGDQFEGMGTLLFHWEDLPSYAQDLTYYFDDVELAALAASVENGNFGIAMDPECHYYNRGIYLKIETDYVEPSTTPEIPEPATTMLLGLALPAAGLACMRRRRG